MTNLVPSRRRYRFSTPELRDEAVSLVKGAMDAQGMSRSRAATIVATNLGFSRSAVVGWCEDADVLASPESKIDRAMANEIAVTREINRILSAHCLNVDED